MGFTKLKVKKWGKLYQAKPSKANEVCNHAT